MVSDLRQRKPKRLIFDRMQTYEPNLLVSTQSKLAGLEHRTLTGDGMWTRAVERL